MITAIYKPIVSLGNSGDASPVSCLWPAVSRPWSRRCFPMARTVPALASFPEGLRNPRAALLTLTPGMIMQASNRFKQIWAAM